MSMSDNNKLSFSFDLVDWLSISVSLDSLRRKSVFLFLIGSDLDDSGVNGASNAVLHLDVELGDNVIDEGSVFLKILFG